MTDIARIELPYEVYDKLTQAQCDELTAAFFDHPIFHGMSHRPEFEPLPDNPDLFKVKHWGREFIVDLDKIDLTTVTIKCRFRQGPAIARMTEDRGLAFNEKVNVTVPSNGLLNITHVVVHTDQCTEVIDQQLKLGWRILAICPQPDQRRPDYILGML